MVAVAGLILFLFLRLGRRSAGCMFVVIGLGRSRSVVKALIALIAVALAGAASFIIVASS